MERHHPESIPSPSSSLSSPTTFVQADATTFRDLVQKLTGAAENSPDKLPITVPARYTSRSSLPTAADSVGPRRSAFKLQERRKNMRKLEIKLGFISIKQHTTSANSTSVISSPVTPLGSDFLSSGSSSPAASEEEKAIAEKGFYLHPSPLSTPRGGGGGGGGGGVSETPELLPLFPLQSPKQQPRDL